MISPCPCNIRSRPSAADKTTQQIQHLPPPASAKETMNTSEIIFHNLFAGLRKDFFNDTSAIAEAMSPWKQRRVEGIRRTIEEEETYDASAQYQFLSMIQEKRRARIFENERHSIDTSVETLQLLNIIVFNISSIEDGSISVKGIITLGRYLREQGHLVDYVKLDNWIAELHIKNMAALLSSLLLQAFGFDKNELPFLYKTDKTAYVRLCTQLAKTGNTSAIAQSRMLMRYSPYSVLAMWRQRISKALDSIEE